MNIPLLNINDIEKLLLHRPPMLMIDKVENINPGESGVGIKAITSSEIFTRGHFPDKYVYPGMYIIEGAAQTSGVIYYSQFIKYQDNNLICEKPENEILYFSRIKEFKFLKYSIPGDLIQFHCTLIKNKSKISMGLGTYHFNIKREDELLASGTLSCFRSQK